MQYNFHSRRRRLGFAVLIVTCGLMIGWVRSRQMHEVIQFRVTSRLVCFIVSSDDWLYGQFVHEASPQQLMERNQVLGNYGPKIFFNSLYVTYPADDFDFVHSLRTEQRQVRVEADQVIFPGMAMTVIRAPYWSLVMPLMILAAWLLISKVPRTSTVAKVGDHAVQSSAL